MVDHLTFEQKENTLARDLHDGNKAHAAVSLLKEFDSNPQEALELVQRSINQNHCKDKLHLNIQANGDVIVWDKGEKNGYYAGKVPVELRPQPAQVKAEQAVPVAPAEPVREAPRAAVVNDAQGPQAYEQTPPRHKGFHIPFPIDVGVHDGSLRLGVNILGLAKGGVTLGEKNRGYVGSDALNTEVSAGVDLNKNHIGPAGDWRVLDDKITAGSARVGITPGTESVNLGAGADASLFGRNVGAGGHGGVELGRRVGPKADGYTYVGPAGVGADGFANLSEEGLQAGVKGDAGAQPYAGVQAGTRFGLGAKNELHADVGGNVGDNGTSVGAGFYPQFHPDVYARAYSGANEAGLGVNPARAWTRNTDEVATTKLTRTVEAATPENMKNYSNEYRQFLVEAQTSGDIGQMSATQLEFEVRRATKQHFRLDQKEQ